MIPHRSFYLLRHGESEANAAGMIAGGELDSPLNETGLAQARALRDAIAALDGKPQRVYHSHQQRARDTAHIVNEALGLDIHEHPHIHEHLVGEWEGRPGHEYGDRLHAGEHPPGGESPMEFSHRVAGAFNEIFDTHPEETLMIVCHGGVFSAIGRLWDHRITGVNNCHLHYFEAVTDGPEGTAWRIWHFDVTPGGLRRDVSPYCPSVALPDSETA